VCGVFAAPVLFQRLRRRGNKLLFPPPPEPSQALLLKKSSLEELCKLFSLAAKKDKLDS
jgi:hypothetical protein